MIIGQLATDFESCAAGRLRNLFKPELRKTTLLLLFLWMSCAFCYYGLVLLSAELSLKNRNAVAIHNCVTFNTRDFMDLMWITFSEFPGIFSTITITKRYGKNKPMALEFLIFSICVSMLSLINSRTLTTAILCIARGVISGLFQAAYMCTPEMYPKTLRSTSIGGCSTIARIGAMATPFVAQVLFEVSSRSAFNIYGLIGLLSAIACLLLPDKEILT